MRVYTCEWMRDKGIYGQGCLPVPMHVLFVSQFAASGELMMSLFWYYRPEHTQGGRDPSTHCEVRLEWKQRIDFSQWLNGRKQ